MITSCNPNFGDRSSGVSNTGSTCLHLTVFSKTSDDHSMSKQIRIALLSQASPFISFLVVPSSFCFTPPGPCLASASIISATASAFVRFVSSSAGSERVSRPPKSQSSCRSRTSVDMPWAVLIYGLLASSVHAGRIRTGLA